MTHDNQDESIDVSVPAEFVDLFAIEPHPKE
jgi:hypothetical protein